MGRGRLPVQTGVTDLLAVITDRSTCVPSHGTFGLYWQPITCAYGGTAGMSFQCTPQASAAAGGSGPSASLRPRERRWPNWSVALLVVLAAVAGVVTYHVVASGPAGSTTAAARKPVTAPQAADKHPGAKNTPAPPAAHRGPRDVVISLTAVSEPCWADLTTPGGATIFQGIIDPGISKT